MWSSQVEAQNVYRCSDINIVLPYISDGGGALIMMLICSVLELLSRSAQYIPATMPGGQTKFSTAWLSTFDSNGQKLSEWCKKGKDDYHGYCIFCAIDIKCDNAGKSQLLQHSTKKKHQEVSKAFSGYKTEQTVPFHQLKQDQAHHLQLSLLGLLNMVRLVVKQRDTG